MPTSRMTSPHVSQVPVAALALLTDARAPHTAHEARPTPSSDEVLFDALDEYIEHRERFGDVPLTDEEREYDALRILDWTLSRAGFWEWFVDGYGEEANMTAAALDRIGAPSLGRAVEAADRICETARMRRQALPPESPRHARIDAWERARLARVDQHARARLPRMRRQLAQWVRQWSDHEVLLRG